MDPRVLVGVWKKSGAPTCADKYPETIAFSATTYRGTRGASQGMICWDAGIYRIEGSNTLVIGTATDELIRYEISLQGDRLDVTDAEGCRFTYQRQSG